MKIEYKILWLDDNISNFIDDEFIKDIESHLMENGFVPIIITSDNPADFFHKLDTDKEYDLILTDYHMSEMNGDKVVEKIRSNEYSIMTEILFYTAQAKLQDTDRISRVSFLETSKKTGRNHADVVIEEAKKLIDLTIKKFQHIVTMRGMIMHETSSLDERMHNIITEYIANNALDDDFKQSIVKPIRDFHKEKFDKYNKHVAKNINKIISDPIMFSASHRASALAKIFELKGINNFIEEYKEEVISIRNKFAHAKLMTGPNGENYFQNRAEDLVFDSNLCKKIRSDIIKHEINISDAEKNLRGSYN